MLNEFISESLENRKLRRIGKNSEGLRSNKIFCFFEGLEKNRKEKKRLRRIRIFFSNSGNGRRRM